MQLAPLPRMRIGPLQFLQLGVSGAQTAEHDAIAFGFGSCFCISSEARLRMLEPIEYCRDIGARDRLGVLPQDLALERVDEMAGDPYLHQCGLRGLWALFRIPCSQ